MQQKQPLFRGIELVVFDLDGTLVDAFQEITDAVNGMLAAAGLPPRHLSEVKRHVGRGARVLVAGILDLSPDDPAIDPHLEVLMTHYHQQSATTSRLYEGAVEAIDSLRARGIRTAVASNKPDALARKVLTDLGLAQRLNWIFGQCEPFPCKPAPDLLRHIMEMAEASPEATVVVGDTPVDVDFARAAGCHVIAVTYGQFERDDLVKHAPDAIVDSLAQVSDLIAK
jgi:phosphoglycolate phosphatase